MNPYMPPAASSAGQPYAVGPDVQVTQRTRLLLQQTRPWVQLIAVLSFLGAALMIIGGLIMLAAGSFVPAQESTKSPFPIAALSLVYIVLAGFYVYPGIKLWSYGGAITRLLQMGRAEDLEAALLHQKSFWKYVGIFTIVFIGLYIVGIGAAVAIGAFGALSRTH